MDTVSRSPAGNAGKRDESSTPPQTRHGGCCDIDFRIDARGDVNIYNCPQTSGPGPSPPEPATCPEGFPPIGACLPVVPGAKHKLGRDYKLTKRAERARVPSAMAAGALHMMRRFLSGKSAANPLESAAFSTLGLMPRNILSCTVAAFDALPPRQRNRLFAPALLLDPGQPLDEAALAAALRQEILQRIGILTFDDPQSGDQERPGRVRVYEPQGEDFFSQVRICAINDLRTASYIPAIDVNSRPPAEIQHDCQINIVDGQPQVNCQVRTSDCPGNSLGPVCARTVDVALGDGVVLQGVNYFSVDAKVRLTDRQSGTVVRDVDAHVWGDVDTPVTEVIGGNTVLINDCRVHDRLTFGVPDDLAPGVYQIQVVVPNITGINALGSELVSNAEFINVIPSPAARFQVVTERIIARKETSPDWLGSDEVGLHTLAAAFDLNLNLVDLPSLQDPNQRGKTQEQKFKDIQDVDFDSGTARDITRQVFAPDQPILGLILCVYGDEIDSQHAYDQQITSTTDYFIDLVKSQAAYIGGALGGAVVELIKAFTLTKLILAGIALAVVAAIDYLVAVWAPADPIIRDAIGLSINDLAMLTSSNAPPPDPATFTAEDGITVNVNKTIPPEKLPSQYRETREYVSDDEDSRYEIIYRYNRVA